MFSQFPVCIPYLVLLSGSSSFVFQSAKKKRGGGVVYPNGHCTGAISRCGAHFPVGNQTQFRHLLSHLELLITELPWRRVSFISTHSEVPPPTLLASFYHLSHIASLNELSPVQTGRSRETDPWDSHPCKFHAVGRQDGATPEGLHHPEYN